MYSIYYKLIPFILYPVISFFLSLILTRICIKVLPVLGVMAYPGERHIHKNPVPTGGGISIVASFFITVIIYLSVSRQGGDYGVISVDFVYKLLVPALILVLGGFIDDRFALKAKYKLSLQFIVCVGCWYNGVAFDTLLGFVLPAYLSFILTVAWIFFFMNAFNLIDGIDGLAAGLGVVASLCMGVVFIVSRFSAEAVLILCLGAACLGFLRYNFFPAKLFMGETGSTFIGFMFGVIGIVSSNKALTLSAVLIPTLAIGVPLFDGFLALWRRIGRKILILLGGRSIKKNWKVFYGDREHIHHRMLDKGWSHRTTTLLLYCLALLFGVIAILSVLFSAAANGLILVITLLVSVSVIRRFAGIELWDSAQIALIGLHKPRRGLLISLLHPFYDVVFIALSFFITQFLFCEVSFSGECLRLLYHSIFYSMLPIVVILHASGVYRIYWLRISSGDFVHLAKMITLGTVLGFILNYFFVDYTSLRLFVAKYGMFYLLSIVFILGERMFLRYVKFTLTKNLYLSAHSHDNVTKVLLYGGGINARFYLNRIYCDIANDPIKVIGIIDDEPVLRKQYVYNCNVFGGSDELPEIFKKHTFDKIVITSENISPEKLSFVEKFCKDNKITLSEAFFSIKDVC